MSSSATGGPDRLIICNLELQCVIGAEDWERRMAQRVIVDIELRGDFRAAADSDDLTDAVDYREVCARAVEVAKEGDYRLLEALADRVGR
ncbi:MAG: dihydroneopterin aldolase, partial [Chloroflexi bacterium]|nr:dihydroneopterin aldolase [Chloroflexota bacterium]